MPLRLLKSVTKTSQRILEQLVAGLDLGDSRKLDSGGSFTAVHVEALHGIANLGVLYSVAHYYEQNGDLVPDPDVVFLRRTDGAFCPVSFQNLLLFSRAVRWLADGTIDVDAREQASLTSFANTFLRNIAEQQGIGGGR